MTRASDVSALLIERPFRLQLCKFADLVNRPPAPWQIRGVLREQSVALLYGKRGCYKSFVALDIAASLATNTPWQDHDIVGPGMVIYVAGEGGGGMVQRARAWAEQYAIVPADVNLLFVTEPAVVTSTSEDMDVLSERIRDAIDWRAEGDIDIDTGRLYPFDGAREWPKLIIIDTLARCFQGNENAQEDMGEFIQGVDRLKHEFGASILILHHTGKDDTKGERGSSALGGACDTIYKLEANTATSRLTMTCEKMKDSQEPKPLALTFKTVAVTRRAEDDPDEELTSVVICSDFKRARIDRLLSCLKEFQPLAGEDLLSLTGIPSATFYRYLKELVILKKILNENDVYSVFDSHKN